MALLLPRTTSSGLGGTPFFVENNIAVTGGDQPVISFTVPGIISKRSLRTGWVSCDWDGLFSLTVNGDRIASGRTGPADRTVPLYWDPPRPLLPGDEVELSFKGANGIPIGVGMEAYLMASDT